MLSKSFEPKEFEDRIYDEWMKDGCFEAADENAKDQNAFAIMIPPPNVTGALHMGHALTNTVQDILTRWRRMRGDNTLWLPGTDHAGIATQTQVEKAIAKEGKGPTGRPLSRHDLGREKFIERVWQWKHDHAGQIQNQLRKLGSSLDWKRERFTMDEGLSTAVREVFVRLYEQDLIYRGERLINWCPRCSTALSDLEVVPTDRKGTLTEIRYPVVEQDGTPLKGAPTLTIATTRPETMLGDTAVAVHPDDERYTAYHGKFVKLPLSNRVVPIITDTYVDKEFGSGGLKVTPAHDFNDYDLGIKHKLEFIEVIDKSGKMTEAAGRFAGLKSSDARTQVLEALKESGEWVKTEDHMHKVGLCQRCDSVAEPLVSKQWFVKIEPLAKPAIEAVESGRIEFTPKNWEKTYFEWMHNIRDWCISRQLWWGHQIPAWYCESCEGITVARTTPTQCQACKAPASKLTQDPDVLDTWFSSALWPFSTLGWPEKTPALKTFYPNSILETGFDIIFFWVARMIMMGLHFMGDVPFRKVYLHAMVRDEKGQKMSKSKGNVIDPLDLIAQHGADPLRLTLASMAGQNRDIKLSVDRVEGYRGFCNKIWNATKFFHLQFEEANGGPVDEPQMGTAKWLYANHPELLPANSWIISRLQILCTEVEDGFSKFELDRSCNAIYEFAWHEFCDWYIEFAKIPLRQGGTARYQTLVTLHYVLEKLLRLMHPVMPFVTEELWQSLPWKKAANTPARVAAGKPEVMTLMLQGYPSRIQKLINADAENQIDAIKGIVLAIRNFRGENNISPKVEFLVQYCPKNPAADSFVKSVESDVKALARITGMEHLSRKTISDRTATVLETVIPIANPPMELRIKLDGLVDVAGEIDRVRKDIERIDADVAHVRGKLTKESFISKAPPELVAKEKAKEAELIQKRDQLLKSIERLAQFAPK